MARVSLTDSAMCMNLINESLFNMAITVRYYYSLWFSIVRTQLHFISVTGNFRNRGVRLNLVAKWVAAWKSLKITVIDESTTTIKRQEKTIKLEETSTDKELLQSRNSLKLSNSLITLSSFVDYAFYLLYFTYCTNFF